MYTMDTLTFTSNVISSLAWPIATIIIVFGLKKPLAKLLLNIKHVKYKDAEFDFEKAITEARGTEHDTSAQLAIPVSQLKLAELSPRGAILESWLELEETLANAAENEGQSRSRPGGISGKLVREDAGTFAQVLTLNGKLSENSYDRFQKLRKIRNRAVHVSDEEICQEDAETFIRLVAELKLEIKNM